MKKIAEMSSLQLLKNLLFIVGMFYLSFVFILNSPKSIYSADFRIYYGVANEIRVGNISKIYDSQFQRDIQQKNLPDGKTFIHYLNLPVSALLFVPLTFFDINTAYNLSILFNLLFIVAAVFILCKKFKIPWENTYLILFFFPVFSIFFNNQLSVLVLLLYVLASTYLEDKPRLAGIFAGLLIFKIQHILMVPFYLLILKNKQDRIKFMISVGLVWLVFLFSNIVLYGPKVFIDYFSSLQLRETNLIQLEKYNGYNLFAFSSLLDPILGNNTAFIIILLFDLCCILFSLFILLRTKVKSGEFLENGLAYSILLALGLNIHTKFGDLIIFIIPLLILSKNLHYKSNIFTWIALGTIFIVPILFQFSSQYIGAFLFVLVGMLGLSLYAINTRNPASSVPKPTPK